MNLTIDEIEAFKRDEEHFSELCDLFLDYLGISGNRQHEFVDLFNKVLVDALSGSDSPERIRARLNYIYSLRPPRWPRPHLRDSELGAIAEFVHGITSVRALDIDRRQRRKIGRITAVHFEELLWRLSR